MKRIKLSQNTEEWMRFRAGKISGSKLKDIVVHRGSGTKLGFYELIAERLSTDTSDIDDPRERGHSLESDALTNFAKRIGKKVKTDCGVWVSDLDDSIMISPDGEIDAKTAIECKCLSSARHLQAYFEKKVPTEFREQVAQYFIVNEKLKTLYVVFYDPRIQALPLHWIEVKREEIEEEIELWRTYQLDVLKRVNDLINSLTF